MPTLLRRKPYIAFITPAFAIMTVLIAVPIAVMIYYSMTDYEIGYSSHNFVGLANYGRLVNSAPFWHSVRITLLYAVLVTSLSMLIGFIIAKLVDQHARVKAVAIAALIVPIAMTPSIAGQTWGLILNSEYGVLNYLLNGAFGIRQPWLGSDWALASVIGVSVWQSAPFAALIMYAGLQSLPLEPFEAAVVDGANPAQVLRHITLPLMRMPITLALIFVSIDALRIFDIPFTLPQGGPGNAKEILGMNISRLGWGMTGWVGRASAASVALMLLTLTLSLVLIGVLRRGARGGAQ